MLRARFRHTFRAHSTSKFVADMIDSTKKLCNPKEVHICNGSEQEAQMLIDVSLVTLS
jgi:GTP-dependent phosphoenolpyruvate carboxykinase